MPPFSFPRSDGVAMLKNIIPAEVGAPMGSYDFINLVRTSASAGSTK
jgi:hypothetical protein